MVGADDDGTRAGADELVITPAKFTKMLNPVPHNPAHEEIDQRTQEGKYYAGNDALQFKAQAVIGL